MEFKVRFFGDTAVAQGSESWEKRKGEPRYGRFVWCGGSRESVTMSYTFL
jgi:hypothetical protein